MNKNEGLISLIIPVYNTEKFVEKCLDSIFAQTYKQIEIIIVNNGSSGNINEIVDKYRNKYPDRVIKLVINERNLGTFHGRGSGMSVADGEYFTFMDADDRISIDYFRNMMLKAKDNNADIVIADLVHEDENENAYRYIIDPLRMLDINIEGCEEVFDFYYKFQGTSYSIYGIWNKIYKTKLWYDCLEFIDAIKEQFALCEDAMYTTIFFTKACKVVNIHDEYYYHFVHSESASANLATSVARATNSIKNQSTAFRQMKQHLERAGLYDKYHNEYLQFKGFHYDVSIFQIEHSKLSHIEKDNLKRLSKELFEIEIDTKLNNEEMFFTQHFVAQSKELEIIKNRVISDDIFTVSFDVFDTALIRSLWQPHDLFSLMNSYYKDITKSNADYSIIRIISEKYTRELLNINNEYYEDITFDDIFESMKKLFNVDEKIIDKMKIKEFEYEKKVISARKTIKKIFDLAIACNKKVIFVSDMYYSKTQIEELLDSCGYETNTNNIDIFVSSEYKVTKNTGNLYKYVNKSYGNIVHIGDNYHSDYLQGKKHKLETIYFPKTTDILCNSVNEYYGGDIFKNIFGDFTQISKSINLRTKLGIVSNKLFDNPFVNYDVNTDFNGDPYNMGYFAGGLFVDAVINNLIQWCDIKDFNEVIFIGEECHLFKEVFDYLTNKFNLKIKSSLIPIKKYTNDIPQVFDEFDLRNLCSKIEITVVTPSQIINSSKNIVTDTFIQNYEKICSEKGVICDKNFSSYNQYYKLIEIIKNNLDSIKIRNINKVLYNPQQCVFLSNMNLSAFHYATNNIQAENIYSILSIYDCKSIEYMCYMKQYTSKNFNTLLEIFLSNYDNYQIGPRVILKLFQNGVLDFIQDYYNIYSLNYHDEYYHTNLADSAINYLLSNAKELDRYILSTLYIDELQCYGSQLWEINLRNNSENVMNNLDEGNINYRNLSKSKRILYLFLFNKKVFRKKVIQFKERYFSK